jgi:hypothetical protein
MSRLQPSLFVPSAKRLGDPAHASCQKQHRNSTTG